MPNARPVAALAVKPNNLLRPSATADRPTHPAQRWRDAVSELLNLQAEYIAWSDALPEALRDTPTAAALEAIVDLEPLAAVDPPRGYGRD